MSEFTATQIDHQQTQIESLARRIFEEVSHVQVENQRLQHAFNAFIDDPHRFSPRGCSTCQSISKILCKDFGCVKELKARP